MDTWTISSLGPSNRVALDILVLSLLVKVSFNFSFVHTQDYHCYVTGLVWLKQNKTAWSWSIISVLPPMYSSSNYATSLPCKPMVWSFVLFFFLFLSVFLILTNIVDVFHYGFTLRFLFNPWCSLLYRFVVILTSFERRSVQILAHFLPVGNFIFHGS